MSMTDKEKLVDYLNDCAKIHTYQDLDFANILRGLRRWVELQEETITNDLKEL